MKKITDQFPITDGEYLELYDKFHNLCKFAAWRLIKQNTKNNHTDDFEDVNQELLMGIIRAGSYYKRQIYIEKCFEVAKDYAKDNFIVFMLRELEKLWHNRTRHGANKQKFGCQQENLLYKIVQTVPQKQKPNKQAPLKIDTKFTTYCKSICWNTQKSMGRKITKEKILRTKIASLSEYSYLGGEL